MKLLVKLRYLGNLHFMLKTNSIYCVQILILAAAKDRLIFCYLCFYFAGAGMYIKHDFN